MARSNILVRLSGRKREGSSNTSSPKGGVKQAPPQDPSWRRRSLASLSRRLSPGLRLAPPSPTTTDSDVAHTPVDVLTTNNTTTTTTEEPELPTPYSKPVELIRQEEYPHMNQGTYLDHSGATIYAHATLARTTTLLLTNLYGNPHSANQPAKLSGNTIDAVRLQTLRFLGADPAHYDLVFTANATAAIKLVADAFRDLASFGDGEDDGENERGFWYGYHRDAHTSLVGVRELTGGGGGCCFDGDAEVEGWLDGRLEAAAGKGRLGLFAWPGQSNLTGRRLGAGWAGRLRANAAGRRGGPGGDTYSLLDAAALAMTGPMRHVFEDVAAAPDFVCVSFYKIFGFPDLGGLVVRKESGHILALRKYFGGGTVSMVSAIGGAWHLSKGLENARSEGGGGHGGGGGTLHEGLEDGTLPFHSILALGEAIDVHAELYGSMDNVSVHTSALARRMYLGMRRLRYANGQPLCKIYEDEDEDENGGVAYGDPRRQGATIAFNVFRADGGYESYAAVERQANDKGVYVRSGGICCPGGLFTALQYEPWQLRRARSAGHHCGSDGISLINELPTGVVRASLGAMSTAQDVDRFLAFLEETFISRRDSAYASSNGAGSTSSAKPEHRKRNSIE
ncbi:pyridoxal phosphate-dependent transferase [Chaetomidium leptoderma]|uniref:Pyridoxal phosphate-dependent transferase n=1 Tax=Chaetomidium leptoderma TaxID=669021 RepID=A0AAN6ZVF0_9PEZI|nr:pyridoxal phosphate-dependent transferase [Chaetomidium leptoderma]